MTEPKQLLGEYVSAGSEAVFRELVQYPPSPALPLAKEFLPA
jgi:hypothetical protein